MSCPFYGKSAQPNFDGGVLCESGGNQCALVTSVRSPCVMEVNEQHPDLAKCERSGSKQALLFAKFKVVDLRAHD